MNILFKIFLVIAALAACASAVPQSLNRAELARVNAARAESRAIVEGFSARIRALSRQATPTLDSTQISLINQILAQVESLLAQSLAGTLTDVALLQLLTDIASTLIPPTTTTTTTGDDLSIYKILF